MSIHENWLKRRGLPLLTDLYELTMMAGHFMEGHTGHGVAFEYVFRDLPPHNGFAVFAGLESLLDYVEGLRFHDDDIVYLRSLNLFEEPFLDYLRDFQPRLTINAAPEGTLVFPNEPIVQVEGNLLEAQLIETALLNFLNYATLIATKAARVCLAAEGDPVMEFGLRRAPGPDGGLTGSRAAYIGGCTSTSNVLAGKVYGIPVAGTHAHSWVMSYPTEIEAFRAFTKLYPKRCTLLVDTYDTLKSGVPNAIKVFEEMRDAGTPVRPSIRLDSGDLARQSKIAYRMIIQAGFEDPLIVGSNDLEEDLIVDMKRQGAKINAWGVGTHLITSREHPALSGVYKLTSIYDNNEWQPRIKLSSNIHKATDPGRKDVLRYFDRSGQPIGDLLCLRGESCADSGTVRGRARMWPHHKTQIEGAYRFRPLLEQVVEDGRRVKELPPVEAVRLFARQQMENLPEEYKRMRNPEIYHVLLSESLGQLKDRLQEEQGNV